MKKAVAAILAMLVLAAVGYLAGGPFMTLGNIREGVAASDQDLLAANIDFPVLRENLKAQLKGSIAKAVTPDAKAPDENEQAAALKKNLSALSAEFAEKLASKMVDVLVTPAGMAKIAGWPDISVPLNAQMDAQESEKKQFLNDARVAFQSLDTVHVIGPGQEGSGDVKFVLSRQGFKWRLTNILLPLETAPPRVAQ